MPYLYATLCTIWVILIFIWLYYLAERHYEIYTMITFWIWILALLSVIFVSFLSLFD